MRCWTLSSPKAVLKTALGDEKVQHKCSWEVELFRWLGWRKNQISHVQLFCHPRHALGEDLYVELFGALVHALEHASMDVKHAWSIGTQRSSTHMCATTRIHCRHRIPILHVSHTCVHVCLSISYTHMYNIYLYISKHTHIHIYIYIMSYFAHIYIS